MLSTWSFLAINYTSLHYGERNKRVYSPHESSSSHESGSSQVPSFFSRFLIFYVHVLMAVTVVSASTMTSARNITNSFFPVRRDRETTFAGSSILNEIFPIPFSFSLFMIFVNGLPWCYWGMKLKLRSGVFCAILHPKHRVKSTGQPAGCFFAPLWLHVVSTSFSLSSVESMLRIDRMSNSNLNVLSGLNLKWCNSYKLLFVFLS